MIPPARRQIEAEGWTGRRGRKAETENRNDSYREVFAVAGARPRRPLVIARIMTQWRASTSEMCYEKGRAREWTASMTSTGPTGSLPQSNLYVQVGSRKRIVFGSLFFEGGSQWNTLILLWLHASFAFSVSLIFGDASSPCKYPALLSSTFLKI